MGNFSGSSQAGESAEHHSANAMQIRLEAGLAALKRQAYQEAIEHLEAVDQPGVDPATHCKAEMGLVKAYAATGQGDLAIAYCQSLQDHANPQVQSWATQTLATLYRRFGAPRYETADSLEQTGFTPMQPSGAEPDETGFTPLSTAPTGERQVVRPPHLPQPELELETEPEEHADLETEAIEVLPSDTEMPDLDAPALSPSLTPPKAKSASRSRPASRAPLPPTPSTTAQPIETTLQPTESAPQWRYANRAQKWTSLGKVDRTKLWALQLGTAVALLWLVPALVRVVLAILNGVLQFLTWFPFVPRVALGFDPTWGIVACLLALLVGSPWLLEGWLKRIYGLKSLSIAELEAASPEALRLLRRNSTQRRQPIPKLQLLPDPAPFLFSYGYLPQQSRIVVSQGLLGQLRDDEIAALYAEELGHLGNWAVGVLAWLTLVAQLPYCFYRSVAAWGDRQHDRVLQSIAVFFSCLGYGLYRFCRFPGLWLSRVRLYYSDRAATELTGNPNGLTRALLKSAIGMAETLQQQGYTSPVLESFDLLMPVGYRQSWTLGSLYGIVPLTSLLAWDRLHPYRRELAVGESHPPLGDRLNLLNHYAQHWHLQPELEWQQGAMSGKPPASAPPAVRWRKLLLQFSPWVGVVVGLGIAALLWFIGWIAYQSNWVLLDWIWVDRYPVLRGFVLLGFGMGLLLQINPAFPDIRRSNLPRNLTLPDLLTQPHLMPIDSVPAQFQGKLLGEKGFANRFYQDLILKTETGCVRLYYTSRAGFLGNLASQARRPTDLMKQDTVTVVGWFRRGVVPALEVETIQPQRGGSVRNGHPIWSTSLAIGCILLGIWLLFRG